MIEFRQIVGVTILLYSIFFHLWVLYKDSINLKRPVKIKLYSKNKAYFIWINNAIILSFFTLSLSNNTLNIFFFIIGLTIILLGSVVKLFAYFNLGNQYNEEILRYNDFDKLQTTGIYKFVRHPMRLGLFLEFAGIAIYSQYLIPFFLVINLLLLQIQRNKIEDNFLAEHFGQKALDYFKVTPSLNLVKGLFSNKNNNSA